MRQGAKRIGEDVSEQLEFIPSALVVIEHVVGKYACPCGCGVATAWKPMQPIEKGLAGPGLLAHVATSKYAAHLPLNRQEDILARHGVEIARSTMCDWMAAVYGFEPERSLNFCIRKNSRYCFLVPVTDIRARIASPSFTDSGCGLYTLGVQSSVSVFGKITFRPLFIDDLLAATYFVLAPG